jgi:DNA-binding winged helix-turn-helix (wHTH) protein
MPAAIVVHCFGPFEFDLEKGELFREGERIPLAPTGAATLAELLAAAGEVVSREQLLKAVWGAVSVSDNTVDAVVSRLRKQLGCGRDDSIYIETVKGRGYRFVARVRRVERDRADSSLDVQLAPHRAFVQGRTELDTLNKLRIHLAFGAFEEAVRLAPDYGDGHVGLAMAYGLAFDATATEPKRDASLLHVALRHARTGCELAPASGEAWSTLAFVFYLKGQVVEAAAAARKAILLDPEDWRHWLRLGYVSWGQERLGAARRVLELCPGLGLAHWLRGTVFIAREAFDAAIEESRLGCAAQDTQGAHGKLAAVGSHLQRGLILAAHGDLDGSVAALTRELAWSDSGQVYARECAANTWYALGAVHRRQGKRDDSAAAFARVLTIAPCHVSAVAAVRGEVPASGLHNPVDVALAQAIVLVRANRHADAARVFTDALAASAVPAAGWLLPVEPFLHPLEHRHLWAEALALVRVRAT